MNMFPYINLLHEILKDQNPFPLIRMPLGGVGDNGLASGPPKSAKNDQTQTLKPPPTPPFHRKRELLLSIKGRSIAENRLGLARHS